MNMSAEEKELFLGVLRERIDALLKAMAPGIQAIAVREAELFVRWDDVKADVTRECLRKYGRAIESAAMDFVTKTLKRTVARKPVARATPRKCSICRKPIQHGDAMVGTGDGSMRRGGSFAHSTCYRWRSRR